MLPPSRSLFHVLEIWYHTDAIVICTKPKLQNKSTSSLDSNLNLIYPDIANNIRNTNDFGLPGCSYSL